MVLARAGGGGGVVVGVRKPVKESLAGLCRISRPPPPLLVRSAARALCSVRPPPFCQAFHILRALRVTCAAFRFCRPLPSLFFARPRREGWPVLLGGHRLAKGPGHARPSGQDGERGGGAGNARALLPPRRRRGLPRCGLEAADPLP